MIVVQTKKRKHSKVRRFLAQWQLQLMAFAGLSALIIFCYIPICWNVIAFQDFKMLKGIAGSTWVGLKHFRRFLVDDTFWMALSNTLGMTASKFILNTIAPILFAVVLNELPYLRVKKVTQTLTYLPHFLSYVVVATLVVIVLGPSGLVNTALRAKGWGSFRFVDDPKSFWGLCAWLDLWKETGWNSILYLAAISGINPELYESAKVDGAGRISRIWYITLPVIRWTFLMLLILNVGNLLSGGPVGSNFSQSRLLGNAFNYTKSYVLDLYTLEMGMSNMRYSFATAVGMFQSIISMILLVTANSVTRRLSGESLF